MSGTDHRCLWSVFFERGMTDDKKRSSVPLVGEKPHNIGDLNNEATLRLFKGGARQVLPEGSAHTATYLLDGTLQKRLERIAQKKGRDVGDVVSDLLIRDVELLEELT